MMSSKKSLTNQERAIINGLKHEQKVLIEEIANENLDRRVFFAHTKKLEEIAKELFNYYHGVEREYADVEYCKTLYEDVVVRIDEYVDEGRKRLFMDDIFSAATKKHNKTPEWEQEIRDLNHHHSVINECLKHIEKNHPDTKRRLSKYKSWKKTSLKGKTSLNAQLGEWADLNYTARLLERHEEEINRLSKESEEHSKKLEQNSEIIALYIEERGLESIAWQLYQKGHSRNSAAGILGVKASSLQRMWTRWNKERTKL